MKKVLIIIAVFTFAISAASAFGQQIPGGTETPTTVQSGPDTVATVPAPVQPKPEGTIRIGVVATKTQLGQEVGAEASEVVRQLWMSYLKGPTIDVVAIEARTPTNVSIEAAQKGCDLVLYSGLSKKTKTSLFGSLVKIAAPVAAGQFQTAGTQNPDGAKNVQQTAAQTGKDAVNNMIASKIGAKEEVALEFNLTTVNGKGSLVKDSCSARAESEGQDVVSTLIEKAAEKVLQAAVKK